MLFKALASLKQDTKWKLQILGKGPLANELKKQACALKINNNIQFMGFQRNPHPYMKNADIFISPSLWEGFGHVLVESMACGTPVLATDCPYGPREILGDDEYGWLVANNDSMQTAEKIEFLMNNPDVLRDKAKKTFARSKDFDVNNIIKLYEKAFIETLNNHHNDSK